MGRKERFFAAPRMRLRHSASSPAIATRSCPECPESGDNRDPLLAHTREGRTRRTPRPPLAPGTPGCRHRREQAGSCYRNRVVATGGGWLAHDRGLAGYPPSVPPTVAGAYRPRQPAPDFYLDSPPSVSLSGGGASVFRNAPSGRGLSAEAATATPVPEPGSLALLATAVAAMLWRMR